MEKSNGHSAQTELVAQGNALVRLENDTQMQVAVQRPRDEAAILKAALSELEIYPSMAEEAIYVKPVGKDDNDKMKYVEGLSIRAAESLANRWGNSAYGGKIISIDEEGANIAAIYLDYETNTRSIVERRVAKFYKARGGNVREYSPDRFDVVISANMSKILREVILRRLPAGLKKEYELKAREVMTTKAGQDIGQRKTAMLQKFASLGVTSTMLETLRGKRLSEFTADDLVELRGTFNALKDGETTLESLFEGGKSTEAQAGTENPELKPEAPAQGQEKKGPGRPKKDSAPTGKLV